MFGIPMSVEVHGTLSSLYLPQNIYSKAIKDDKSDQRLWITSNEKRWIRLVIREEENSGNRW